MVVQNISSMAELENIMNSSGKKLIIIDFYADWCGPCRFISPYLEELSNEFTNAIFLKVNVDFARDIAGRYRINAMPTFVFISDKQEIDRMQGASRDGLKNKINGWINYIGPVEPSKLNPKAANGNEKQWLQQFVHYTDMMKQYEDEINQTLARSLLPLEDLLSKVTINNKRNDYEFAKLLLNWFHDEFFTWTDQPICEKCGIKTNKETMSNGLPTEDERENGAGRVEVYRCLNCKKDVRFPRYNNPAKLLETRNGRCGEWANCFALICRSTDLETRFITDNADHVWVEIYSNEQKRWIHCDPCENVIDIPLMYEKGWNKKLSYVFAFAKDHCQDVTWRYTFDRKLTTKRRDKCRPLVLLNFLNKLNTRLQKDLPDERKNILKQRYFSEYIEFIWPWNNLRKGKTAENQGRASGSEEWKKNRGEAGTCNSLSKIIIKPSQKEIKSTAFEIIYNSSRNEYIRTNDEELSTKNWESQVYESENIFRKVEKDWKKVYLARNENTEKGSLVYKIDLNGLKIKKILINLNLFTKDNGNINGTVCCGMQCQRISNNGIVVIDDIDEADYLEIHLELFGGNGNCAWQHSQLFRTDLDNKDEPGLKIRVDFD